MARKIAVFVNTNNLYGTVGARYGRKLSYQRYLDFCMDLGDVQMASAYLSQVKSESKSFITCLRKFGYYTVIKKSHNIQDGSTWDVQMALDSYKFSMENNDIDTFIFGTSLINMIPIYKELGEYGKTIIILASKIPHQLKRYAQCIEIPKSLTEDPQELMERKALMPAVVTTSESDFTVTEDFTAIHEEYDKDTESVK